MSHTEFERYAVIFYHIHEVVDVHVIPRAWGGQGLLGLVVKFDFMQEGEEQGVRVLEVQKNSPAFAAGLIPYKDYIIGSGDIIVRSSDDFAEIIRASGGSAVNLTIYNSDVETTREVGMTPRPDWGGDGVFGCGIGTGLLHRIPLSRRHAGAPLNLAEDMPSEPAIETEASIGIVPATEPAPSQVVTDPTSPREPMGSARQGTSPRSPQGLVQEESVKAMPVVPIPVAPPLYVEVRQSPRHVEVQPVPTVEDVASAPAVRDESPRPMSQESAVMVDPVPPVIVEKVKHDRSPHRRPSSEESGYVVETFPQLGGSSPQSIDVSAAFTADSPPVVDSGDATGERLAKLFD